MDERWRLGSEGSNQNAKVRLSRLAERQFGRISAAQLSTIGVGKATIAAWKEAAYLHRVLPSVYAVGHPGSTIEGDLAAALLYAGPHAVLSHATAAWWCALIDHQPSTIEVSTRCRRASFNGIRVHDRRNVERVQHRRLPVTSIAQTLVDFAAAASIDHIRYALAEADYRHLLDVRAIERATGRGRPGSRLLRQALERHQPRYALTRSRLERAFLELCERYRIPIPQVNVYVAGWLVDAVWPERRLVVELDGHQGHRTRAQLERDHERDLQLRAAGFTVVRYTWEQITKRPRRVAEDVQRLFARA